MSDLLRAALEGERATSESARKSQAVTAGLKRRAARGQPVGALPVGVKAEPVIGPDGQEPRASR